MKAKNTGEELVKVSYRLPKGTLELLEKIAVKERRSINDELICLLNEAFRQYTIAEFKETAAAISSLLKVEEYAADRGISIDRAMDELGITEFVAKVLAADPSEGRPKKAAAPEPAGKGRKAKK